MKFGIVYLLAVFNWAGYRSGVVTVQFADHGFPLGSGTGGNKPLWCAGNLQYSLG